MAGGAPGRDSDVGDLRREDFYRASNAFLGVPLSWPPTAVWGPAMVTAVIHGRGESQVRCISWTKTSVAP